MANVFKDYKYFRVDGGEKVQINVNDVFQLLEDFQYNEYVNDYRGQHQVDYFETFGMWLDMHYTAYDVYSLEYKADQLEREWKEWVLEDVVSGEYSNYIIAEVIAANDD